MSPSEAEPAHGHGGLAGDSVGLVPVVFQSVANMAPGASVAYSILFAAQYAGGATPLAVIVGLGLCALVAITIGQLAKHLPSAGGLATYNAYGLGAHAGFLVGWAFILAELVVAPGGLLILGIVISGALHTHLGWPTWTWAPAVGLGGLIVWWLVLHGIRLSTSASALLGAFEILVFLALAITVIVHAGGHNTLSVFTPHNHNRKGIGSLVPGILYAVFGIIGFEAAAPLGEEARNPRRTVPRAVVLACLTIGAFYLLCYYGATVYFGPARMTRFASANAGDPWSGIANTVWGLGSIAVIVALVNSALAGSNASSVASTRVGYALGRVGMLPRLITRIDPRYDTPANAVHAQAVLAIGYALALGFALGAPLKALALQGTISTTLIVAIYICTGASCIVFYLREHRDEFNVILHLLVPLVAAVLFIPVLLAALGVDFAGLGIQPLASPANVAPYVAAVWMLLGLVVLVQFARSDPSRIAGIRRVFGEPEADAGGSAVDRR